MESKTNQIPLEQNFEAHEKKVELPKIYANFNKLSEYADSFERMSKNREMPYGLTYTAGWNVLTMSMDREKQTDKINSLRSDVKDKNPEERKEKYANYWDNIDDDSSHSLYKKILEDNTEKIDAKVESFSKKDSRIRQDGYVVKAANFYPNVGNKRLAEHAFGAGEDKQSYRLFYLNRQITELAGKEMSNYLCAVYAEKSAREITLETIANEIKNSQNISDYISGLMKMTREEYIKSRVLQTEPYRKVSQGLSEKIRGFEIKKFGEDIFEARLLWRTLFYLQTSNLPKKISANQVREPILKELVAGNYENSKRETAKLYIEYPDLFNKEYLETVGIDETYLKNLTSEIEEDIASQPKSKAETKREDLVKVEPYVGKTFVAADGSGISFRLERRSGSSDYRPSQSNYTRLVLTGFSEGTVNIEGVMRELTNLPRGEVRIRPRDVVSILELFNMKVKD